jgi:hypothetical protein
MKTRPRTGEAFCYERRQLSLDCNDWQDLDELAKARGQQTMKMLRELIEIIVHDNLVSAIFDDGKHERRPDNESKLSINSETAPSLPALSFPMALSPRLFGTLSR